LGRALRVLFLYSYARSERPKKISVGNRGREEQAPDRQSSSSYICWRKRKKRTSSKQWVSEEDDVDVL